MGKKDSLQPLGERPMISIIIPSYNQGAFIRKTIESCLEQDYRPIEIVVMDGGSTDGTVAVLESFGAVPELRWVSEPDDGVVDAVNRGLRKARGEIAAIQSSDDYYLPGAFRAVAREFREHPCAGLVFGDVERVDSEEKKLFSPRQAQYSLSRLLAREMFVYQPAAFFRRDLALKLGGWIADIPYTPDIDLWIKLAFHADVVQCKAVVGAYRTHPGQRDIHRDRIYASYLKMIKMSDEIQTASLRLRLAAKAGASLLKFRYGGPWTDWQLTRSAWVALICKPSLWNSAALPKHRLVPGYFTMTGIRRKLLDRMARQ